jgi:hypothetical protein
MDPDPYLTRSRIGNRLVDQPKDSGLAGLAVDDTSHGSGLPDLTHTCQVTTRPQPDGTSGYADLGRFGPFFGLDVIDDIGAPTVGWRPVSALIEDPQLLAGRVQRVHAALVAPGSEPDQINPGALRVAASVTQLGLCARLVAVSLASAVDGLPLPTLSRLAFQDRLGGPYPLALIAGERPAPAVPWPTALVELVGPVVAAVQTAYRLSPQVGWGNVASALVSAASLIATADAGMKERAAGLAADALGQAELSDTMERDRRGRLRRRSCCLIYRLAGPTPAFCGDCVLAER